MKREIVSEPEISMFEKLPDYPGENVKIVSGYAIHDYLCDQTARPIRAGDFCYAVSIYRDGEYYQWEQEYLNTMKQVK